MGCFVHRMNSLFTLVEDPEVREELLVAGVLVAVG